MDILSLVGLNLADIRHQADPYAVSNIALPLNQTDSERPSESTQELLIRVREGLTSQIMKHGGKAGGYEVPLKAWTEGPCEWQSNWSCQSN